MLEKSLNAEHPFFDNKDFAEAWNDYWQWRIKKKLPTTERVRRNLLKKAIQYGDNNVLKATMVIDQSLESGWQTLYPLKDMGARTESFNVVRQRI
jgi:hypothetical protein